MSRSMGIASVLVLSSFIVSPWAMAEESIAFRAQNIEREANFQQRQEMTAKAHEQAQPNEHSASRADADATIEG